MATIYFLQADKYVKIGITVNVASRMESLQCGCPYELKLLRTIKGCTAADESWLHMHYKGNHFRGEWFVFDITMLTVEVERLAPTTEYNTGIKLDAKLDATGIWQVSGP